MASAGRVSRCLSVSLSCRPSYTMKGGIQRSDFFLNDLD